jgi:7,8-dihydropterin-6-yl-methyl-4-(beta-D-ribofuranosyl)aminobenzene 5'-phosphate synthase
MNVKAHIAVLAENTAAARNARGEHGLAFWIETDGRRLLFDTGQGLVLADNARALNIDLGVVDTLVLSHGHYDHTGGLAAVLRQAAGEVRVHAHPDALLPKYHRTQGAVRKIGMPAESRDALSGPRCRLITSLNPTEVTPGVWSTGEIPRRHIEETPTETFCKDPDGRENDPLLDDQALFIETVNGIVVLLGCAHAGVINTLDHIQLLANGRPIHAVLGGMHLGAASEARLAWTIGELRRFDLHRLAAMHCTGAKASAALWHAFPDACREWGAGTICEF